jgi:hypothetical protein
LIKSAPPVAFVTPAEANPGVMVSLPDVPLMVAMMRFLPAIDAVCAALSMWRRQETGA